MITSEKDLRELVHMAAEAADIPCKKKYVRVTPSLAKAWESYETAVYRLLHMWARKHVWSFPEEWAERVFHEGYAPLNVLLTVRGEGAGIWDGRWDAYFLGRLDYLEKLRKFLQKRLERTYVQIVDDALIDAAYECAKVVDLRGLHGHDC